VGGRRKGGGSRRDEKKATRGHLARTFESAGKFATSPVGVRGCGGWRGGRGSGKSGRNLKLGSWSMGRPLDSQCKVEAGCGGGGSLEG